MRLIVGMTGASGVIYGVRLLQILKDFDCIETHLIVSEVGKKILKLETDYTYEDLAKMADFVYDEDDLFAPPSSGSSRFDAMVIIPCSMKTLAAISQGFSHNLITRAADVMMKEGRKLVIVPRETPLNGVHIENMLRLSREGVSIVFAAPAFYHRPKTLMDVVDFVVGKVLDRLGIEHNLYERWERKGGGSDA
ncbi:MAG: UbiX family flavin prenyltransferase [Candidatus Asgardarchaeia archaeon]